ncbi:MAG: DUF2849 domain-containing protein [Beijerinckiaceae bacterium]|nr:DUF2849 domain-containing protein [Beijerinckiaceae bacterium]
MSYAISANRLSDGAVVFLGQNGWVESLASAEIFAQREAAEAALGERAHADARRNLIIEPLIFDIRARDGVIEASHIREAIRAKGPTIRPDLGKQAVR